MILIQDMKKVETEYEKYAVKQRTDKDLWGYLKKREMTTVYPEDKIGAIIKRRTEQGWFVDDDDFPDDIEERAYLVRLKRTAAKEAVSGEKVSRKAVQDLAGQEEQSTFCDSAIFQDNHAAPNMSAKVADDVWKSLMGNAKVKARHPQNKKQETMSK